MLVEIPGYKNYLINESGVIIDKNNNMVRTAVNNNGFMYVYLDNKKEFIHDLVAKAFLEYNDSDDYVYPNHKDGDSLNNHLSNIILSNNPDCYSEIDNRSHRKYSGSDNIYEVYNESTGDSVLCIGRGQVAELIQYEEISLKNMVGNGRKIFLGPYKGYQIRRIEEN